MAAVPVHLEEARALQLFQMKRQGGRPDVEFLDDIAGCEPFGTALDQQSVNRQPRLLSKGGKSRDGIYLFHDFNHIE